MNTKRFLFFSKIFVTLLCSFLSTTVASAENTIQQIIERKSLNCGLNTEFSENFPSTKTYWLNFQKDFCKALAVSILGKNYKVNFFENSKGKNIQALKNNEIDLLIMNKFSDISGNLGRSLNLVSPLFFDDLTALIKSDSIANSLKGKNNQKICLENKYLNIAKNKLSKNELISQDNFEKTVEDFKNGKCSFLLSTRSNLTSFLYSENNKSDYKILNESIDIEVYGPVIRYGDDQFLDTSNWIFQAIILSEEKGIESDNIHDITQNVDPYIKFLFGTPTEILDSLQISNSWLKDIMLQVGNYAEIFNRTIGNKKTLNLYRGKNQLWFRGGLHYGIPHR